MAGKLRRQEMVFAGGAAEKGALVKVCWRIRAAGAAVLAVLVLLAAAGGKAAAEPLAAEAFPVPVLLKPNVEFWTAVFTRYSTRDFVVHDRSDLRRVYQVLHLPGSGTPSRDEAARVSDYLKDKYRHLFLGMAAGGLAPDYEQRRVAALFGGGSPVTYLLAADNLRVQQGLREPFKRSLLLGRYYRPAMERILRANGLPPQLTALVAVESGFIANARSKAGAVGLWQFTAGTGRQYLRISRYFDERLDPLRSTEAAAELLRENYELFHSWPLAITAYNYGSNGTARAARACNNDFERMLMVYDGRSFGFAVKNYYAEFLAALTVQRDAEKFFPGVSREAAPPPPPVAVALHPRPRLSYAAYRTGARPMAGQVRRRAGSAKRRQRGRTPHRLIDRRHHGHRGRHRRA